MRGRARSLRRNMTDAEQLLWRELRRNALGWRFRRQFPVTPYIVDFAYIEARLIIEIDGGQHAIAGEHDRRDNRLRRQGWRLLRFWNNEVFENRTGMLKRFPTRWDPGRPYTPTPTLPASGGGGSPLRPCNLISPPPLAGEG